MTPQPVPAFISQGLSASVKYMVANFLSDKQYTKISGALANKWERFQSLTAAVKLMEQHGVQVTPEEEERMSGLSEMQMIESLVAKMPQQSKEQFQHFFLQLQLIVSTATRVRTALETGRADLVERAMDDADSTGISQYILKMCIVQAGSEVTNLKRQHECWVKDAESKMSRLVRGAEDAIIAKERLAKAQGELATFQANQNEGIKKVLMALAGGSTTALLHAVLSSWHNYVLRMKVENTIYEEFREAIEMAEVKLVDAKAGNLKSISGVINKKFAGTKQDFLQEVFDLWKADLMEAKKGLNSAEDVAAMEARLKEMQSLQSKKAQNVLIRCGAASEKGLRDMMFGEWKTFHEDYAKNKELEDAVKAEEQKIAAFMKKHSENAQGLMNSMSASTDAGLIAMYLQAWIEYYKEEKRANEFAEVMNGQNAKFGQFGARNKKGAQSVMERAHEHGLVMLYLKVFGAWRIETKIEQTCKAQQGRVDGKRSQLLGVQQMFRTFATQLETNIQSGAESSRDLAAGPPQGYKKGKGMQRNDGSVSLPDIHSKPGSHRSRR